MIERRPVQQDPYPGPRPFRQEERSLFFGRDAESRDIFSLVTANRLLLVHAQSGAGKTSLVHASLIPILIEQGFQVLRPPARVGEMIPKDIQPKHISNIYVLATLMSWKGKGELPTQLLRTSLADFLKKRRRALEKRGNPKPRVLIFDQFEEIFTAHVEHWEKRRGFFEQVREALEADPSLRVVFLIREDYIAQLDPYANLLPGRLQTRFRLERLGETAALDAVTKPLEGTGRCFAKGVPEQLVKDLRKERIQADDGRATEIIGEFAEPIVLQVVCQRLWSQGDIRITSKDLPSANRVLSHFYDEAIRATASHAPVDESRLRSWCERRLITPMGTRGTVYLGPRGMTAEIPNSAVMVLEREHLIRGDWRAGARWYELTHDRLIEPIRASNEEFRKKQQQFGLLRVSDHLSLMSAEQLMERERPVDEGGDLLVKPRKPIVLVNAVRPVEHNDRMARAVTRNLMKGVNYEYFFGHQESNLGLVAELLWTLAAATLTDQERRESKRIPVKEHTARRIIQNLKQMRKHLSIHFLKPPPRDFCVHNAYSEEAAVCYARDDQGRFGTYLEAKEASEVAGKLMSSCIAKQKAACIFHSTSDISLADSPFRDELMQLTKERFPDVLHQKVEEICFETRSP